MQANKTKSIQLLTVILLICALPLRAEHIAGDWQGTIHFPSQPDERVEVHVTEHGEGTLTAMVYWVDYPPDGLGVTTMSFHDSEFKFSLHAFRISYAGKINAAGSAVRGTWNEGILSSSLTLRRVAAGNAWLRQPRETISFIPVAQHVKLEVIDWGGTGRPLVLLAGLGNTAHVYDTFAPKLASKYHVYGITRRGFGESSSPPPTPENYSADRLGDDVLAVLSALKLQHAVLIGHSIAGEELSSIGSRYPARVAGLVYLDAGGAYALYDPRHPDAQIDENDVRRALDQLAVPGGTPGQRKEIIDALLREELPLMDADLKAQMKELGSISVPISGGAKWASPLAWVPAATAVIEGMQKFTNIHCPALAIFAVPHKLPPDTSALMRARDIANSTAHADLFRIDGATVIEIPNASHFVYRSNEAEVLKAINAFVEKLPQADPRGLLPNEATKRTATR
jgi:non-heme chloroperoxidase